MRIISRVENLEGFGSCDLTAEKPAETYQEIRRFMFDCLGLINVEMISIDELQDFISSNVKILKLGTTQEEDLSKCHFELHR